MGPAGSRIHRDTERWAADEALLRRSFAAAVAAADPLLVVPPALPEPPSGRTVVIGAGKAAAAMARAVELHWPSGHALEGLVITRHGHSYPPSETPRRLKVVEAGHPVPDEAGEAAAHAVIDLVRSAGPDDLLLALFSGGGSSLFSLPAPSISMADLKTATAKLLRCGAPIQAMNIVRKHLSLVQGGRLAAMCQAPIVTLLISDVVGDAPTHIASGPTVPDPTTYQDALDVLEHYRCTVPDSVRGLLVRGAAGEIDETLKPGAAVFERGQVKLVATAQASLEAAAAIFRTAGVRQLILGDDVTGEAREVAKIHAALVREVRRQSDRLPLALISGGECTVTVRNPTGRGGRCAEYLLALALELEDCPNVLALAADTDGIDGTETNAGAVLLPNMLEVARQRGIQPDALLAANDAYGFFAAVAGLVEIGPTRTNVNDYRVILVR